MLSVNTPAKINLFLNIRGPREDGYHELCMVMLAVSLFDTLNVWPNHESNELLFTCDHPALNTEDPKNNLVAKAYDLFFQWTELPKLGLTVHLEKRIPVQAGLGGGSSDAAAMLQVLNELTCANLSYDELRQMATHLGSDVPFFLTGGAALAKGRGEQLEPLYLSPDLKLSFVIIKPRAINISTADAYGAVREQAAYAIKSPESLLTALSAARLPAEIEPLLLNDFEPVILAQNPLLAQHMVRLKGLGIHRPLMSGSGPSLVGLTEDTPENRGIVARHFPATDFEVFWAQNHPTGLTSGLVSAPAALQ